MVLISGAPSAAQSSDSQYLAASDVAFDGTAVAETNGSGTNTWTFRVDASVKGSPSNPQNVNAPSGGECAIKFDLGTQYRVYAKRDGDTLTTSSCMGTHAVGSPPPTTATTRASAGTTTTAPRPATSTTSKAAVTSTSPPTIALDTSTTAPFVFDTTTTTSNNTNAALHVDNGGGRSNRVVIATILAAAAAAIGAGVILWRRGP